MQTFLLQSTGVRIALKVYLSSDHISSATGKSVAVTISKNGSAFANPSAGATVATEVGGGWYYVDLSTTDTGTIGPLIVLGTAAACDPVEQVYPVLKATNLGMTGVPDAAANADGGLPVLSSAGTTLAYTVSTLTTYTGNTPQTGDAFARIGATGSGLTALAPAATALSTAQWTGTRAAALDFLDAAISTRSTYAGGDTPGTTTLLGRLPSTLAITAGKVDVNDRTGFVLAAAGLDAVAVEAGLNARQALAIMAAILGGTGGTASGLYRGAGVATTRVTFTAANGERSAIILSPPA